MLEPAMLAIPLERPRDAVAQADLRRVAELLARARDVERAALRIEVDAPPVNRRLDAERRAHGLAQRARDPERPDRQVQRRRWYAGHIGTQRHQLVQRRHLASGEDVGAIRRRRMLAAQ